MTPTPQQLAACAHVRDSERNLAVRARAGTGKTTLLVQLTEQISGREKALAVAFNKSIAEELRSRVPRRVDVKTLHGLGFAAIQRAWGRRLETDSQRQRSYAREVVPESGNWSKRTVVGTVCKLVSLAMGQLATTPDAVASVMYEYGVLADRGVKPEQYVDWAVQVIARSRTETTAISFDDMVFLPAIEKVMTGANDVVFLDEAQDANPAQKALVLAAVRRGGKVVIVGDDRQAIYRWRGAGDGAFDDLVNELKAEVLPLTWTFRENLSQ
jgi:superfamily I DNA/RNA helicase